jgi:perosamine synthetase
MSADCLSYPNANLGFRRVTMDDAGMLFAWRNLPEIVALGSTRRRVEWSEHRAWLQQMMASGDHLLLIILVEDQPIGQVRFGRTDDETCEVSIYLLSEYTGRGLGVAALERACTEAFAHLRVQKIVAVIREDNARSLAAFQRVGFTFEPSLEVVAPAGHTVLRLLRAPDVPHNRLTHGVSEERAILDTVRTGCWAHGPRVLELEGTLAQSAGVDHAVCVASGLSALRLALLGLGVAPGDAVIIPAYACVALANAVLACGASPVPVDVHPEDWNISAACVAETLESLDARALVAVNTFGAPAPIDALVNRGVPVIEDCAHAFGTRVDGDPLGGRAHVGILSFYATKLVGAGEGGAVLTNSAGLAQFVRSWRDYGDQAPDGKRLNDNMSDLEAALALSQLARLQDMLEARRQRAERYHELFSGEATRTGAFRLPNPRQQRVWYRYAVEMHEVPAAPIVQHLQQYGIHAAQPVTDWRAEDSFACPVADRAHRHVISLPLYPTLTRAEQDRVAHAFLEVCKRYAAD